jgi:hypothetical protein
MDEHDSDKEAGAAAAVQPIENDRANNDSGIGAIYSELESLASRYRISDAAVVLMNESFGTQIFRLRGRAVSADLALKLDSHPGVYCTPSIVPQTELDAVYSACQKSFASHFDRYNTAHFASVAQERPQDETESPKPPLSHSGSEPEDSVAPTSPPARTWLRNSSPHSATTRALVSRFLIVVDVAVFILTVGSIHGPVRLVLGLVFGLFVPGWCIVGLLKLENAPLEISLTLAVSLSLLMVVAQILITINEWHLGALEIATCIVCLPFLILQSGVRRSVGQHSQPVTRARARN